MSAAYCRRSRVGSLPAGRPRIAAVFVLALLVACGDSPTAPDPGTQAEINVAGDWSGTWAFNAAGLSVTDDLTVTLGQSGGMVTGTWVATSGASGQIRFNATRQLSGTLTINQVLLGSTSCNGSTSIEGTAATDRIEIELADIPPQGVCQWGTGSRFLLTR